MSDIEDYIACRIKKHEKLSIDSPIDIYINKINNRLVFEMKDGYKLELETPETMTLLDTLKKLIDKT